MAPAHSARRPSAGARRAGYGLRWRAGWADHLLVSPDDGPGSGGALAFEVRLLGPVQVVRAGGR